MSCSLYCIAPESTRMGGVTSAPKTCTSRRLKPRRGPNPSPCRCAVSTAAFQSGSTPISTGRIGKRFPRARKTTGASARRADRRSRSVLASVASRPPTSTPSIVTPPASFVGEPAKTRPRTTAVATTESSKKKRRLPTSTRVPGRFQNEDFPKELASQRSEFSEHEKLDAARDVELDAGDVRGEVGAKERDRVRDLLGLARTAKGRPLDDPLVRLGVRHRKRFRPDHAGHDRVAGDAMAGAFHGERARQTEETGLRRRVARLAEPAEGPGNRRHVDDAAPPSFTHVRPHGLRAVEGAGQ